MTTRVRVHNEGPTHGPAVRVVTLGATEDIEFEVRDLKPGQSETFHLHSGNRLNVYELPAPVRAKTPTAASDNPTDPLSAPCA